MHSKKLRKLNKIFHSCRFVVVVRVVYKLCNTIRGESGCVHKVFFFYSSISAMRGLPTCISLLVTLLPGSVGLSLHLPGSPGVYKVHLEELSCLLVVLEYCMQVEE